MRASSWSVESKQGELGSDHRTELKKVASSRSGRTKLLSVRLSPALPRNLESRLLLFAFLWGYSPKCLSFQRSWFGASTARYKSACWLCCKFWYLWGKFSQNFLYTARWSGTLSNWSHLTQNSLRIPCFGRLGSMRRGRFQVGRRPGSLIHYYFMSDVC